MCRDTLCERGNNGICYFERDLNRIARTARDLAEDDWDELDRLHDSFLANPTSQATASLLGIAILSRGEEATDLDKDLGARRFEEMRERYANLGQRPARKVTLLRTDDPVTAAQKVRELGDQFANALRHALS